MNWGMSVMTRMMMVALFGVTLAAQAQEKQRPTVALLPLDLPTVKFAVDQKEFDNIWYGMVARKKKVDLVSSEEVKAEFQRKFKSACPDNDLYDCLAWLAEHSSATYAVMVKLKKLSPKEWQWVASIGAKNKTAVEQPVLHTFAVPDPKLLKETAKKELDAYLGQIDLDGLPLNPGVVEKQVQVVVVDVPKKPVDVVTVKPVEPKVLVVPAKPVEPQGGGMKTVGLAVGALGVAAAVAGGVVFGMQASEADRIAKNRVGGSLLLAPDDAQAYASVHAGQAAGVALMIAGGAALVGGVVTYLIAPAAKAVAIVPVEGGAVVGFGGSLP